ncbi:MAG: hypothetical protein D6732_07910 [Methanobacteriota archaeon]|nr:MAG: hypothetical protein D6732_07910 [Euryarchaeota archaeon]
MPYEFSDEEAEKMWIFGNQIMIFSSALFVIGIFGVGDVILTVLRAPFTFEIFVRLVSFLGTIGISILLIRPSDNFKKISVSEGRDISELMQGLREFNMGFVVISVLLILIGVLLGILIVSGG